MFRSRGYSRGRHLQGPRQAPARCRFRRTVGAPIKDYLERLRISAACELLTLDRLTVFDVALSVGYYHPQTFYNVFRRRLGCTPSEYRGRLQNTDTGRTTARFDTSTETAS